MTDKLDLAQQAIATALNKMLRQSYFDICTLDKCADLMGIALKGNPDYKILSTLHCVHYAEMPTDLRLSIPMLIKDCLGIQIIPVVRQEEVHNSWFRRLLL